MGEKISYIYFEMKKKEIKVQQNLTLINYY